MTIEVHHKLADQIWHALSSIVLILIEVGHQCDLPQYLLPASLLGSTGPRVDQEQHLSTFQSSR